MILLNLNLARVVIKGRGLWNFETAKLVLALAVTPSRRARTHKPQAVTKIQHKEAAQKRRYIAL